MKLVDEQKLAALLHAGADVQLSAFVGLVESAVCVESASSDAWMAGLFDAELRVGAEPSHGGGGRDRLVDS